MSDQQNITGEGQMYDKNGFQLRLGDHITFDGGKGRIEDYLGDGGKFGARVRVITTTGQRVDIALLLAQAEYKPPVEEYQPTQRYGV